MEENSKKLTNLDQIGEFGLIDSITKDFEIVNDTTELSVGDDAAILGWNFCSNTVCSKRSQNSFN